jgi:hypothetical protein
MGIGGKNPHVKLPVYVMMGDCFALRRIYHMKEKSRRPSVHESQGQDSVTDTFYNKLRHRNRVLVETLVVAKFVTELPHPL